MEKLILCMMEVTQFTDLRLRANNIVQKSHYKYLMLDQAGPFLLLHHHSCFCKKEQVMSFSFQEINSSDLK